MMKLSMHGWTAGLLLAVLMAGACAAPAAKPQDSLGFDPSVNADLAADAYLAPENRFFLRLRLPNGAYREFGPGREGKNRLIFDGRNGWSVIIPSGANPIVRTGSAIEGGQACFEFANGRTTFFRQGNVVSRFPYWKTRHATLGPAPYCFGSNEEREVGAATEAQQKKTVPGLFKNKWTHSGRLQIPFANPNENGFLFASLSLLFLSLCFLKSRAVKIAGVVLSVLSALALLFTASRGSYLGYALGLVAFLVPLRKAIFQHRKLALAVSAAVLALFVAFVAVKGAGVMTRGFTGKSSWSNQIRLDMWKAAPQMMMDAPGGWGRTNIGKDYMDWYESPEWLNAPGSLMNDHLTRLVRFGWTGRFLYLFGWGALLLLLAVWGVRTGNGVPLAVWLAFAVSAWFNPLQTNMWLWIAPVAALWPLALRRRDFLARASLYALGGAVAGAVLCLVAVPLAAHALGRESVPLRADGPRVVVNGKAATTWIVGDGYSLGGILTCKDIRKFYRENARSRLPAVGYVSDIADLPARVDRLVLSRYAADAWLKLICENAEARANLPREVVLITPPFPPSAVPPPLYQTCSVSLVYGEFAARYLDELAGSVGGCDKDYAMTFGEGDAALSVKARLSVVTGMELYIDGWMRYALRRTDGER